MNQTNHTTSDGRSMTLLTSTTRHDPTDSDARNGNPMSSSSAPAAFPPGLTTQQEQAAAMLASGKGVGDVADALQVHRSTVWAWKKLPTFIAYTNSLVLEIKDNTRLGVLSLYSEAVETFRRVLQSDNGVAALKAATYIIERVKGLDVGTTNAREIVRQMCTTVGMNDLDRLQDRPVTFDEESYRRICSELGIGEEIETSGGKANDSKGKQAAR